MSARLVCPWCGGDKFRVYLNGGIAYCAKPSCDAWATLSDGRFSPPCWDEDTA